MHTTVKEDQIKKDSGEQDLTSEVIGQEGGQIGKDKSIEEHHSDRGIKEQIEESKNPCCVSCSLS